MKTIHVHPFSPSTLSFQRVNERTLHPLLLAALLAEVPEHRDLMEPCEKRSTSSPGGHLLSEVPAQEVSGQVAALLGPEEQFVEPLELMESTLFSLVAAVLSAFKMI